LWSLRIGPAALTPAAGKWGVRSSEFVNRPGYILGSCGSVAGRPGNQIEEAMKTKDLVQSLARVLDRGSKSKKRAALKKVIKALKMKRNRIQKKLESVGSERERKGLEAKLKVIRAQRKKGLKALRKLDGKE
jgi:hypothetical protein